MKFVQRLSGYIEVVIVGIPFAVFSGETETFVLHWSLLFFAGSQDGGRGRRHSSHSRCDPDQSV